MLLYRRGQTAPDKVSVPDSKIGVDSTVKFPATYFHETAGKPPLLLVPEIPLDKLLRTVIHGLETHVLDPRTVTAFLFEAFQEKPVRITEEWSSFNQLIAHTNDEVRISNLFAIARDETPAVYQEGDVDMRVLLKYLVVVSTIYRLNGISLEDYKARTILGANRLIMTIPAPEFDFQAIGNSFLNWNNYPQFRKIIAGIDMFLQRFPQHDYSITRYGTIVSRLKDCASLPELDFITRAMTIRLPILSTWIWTESIADQFDRVLMLGQEIDDPYSYCMYTTEMGLAPKSPYSVTLNPDLHFWIHILGASRRELRSINARIVGTVDRVYGLSTAMICAYVFSTKIAVRVQYHANPNYESSDEEEDAGGNEDAATQRPKDRDAYKWLTYLEECHMEVPLDIQRHLALIWQTFFAAREGTIGRFLYEESQRILVHANPN